MASLMTSRTSSRATNRSRNRPVKPLQHAEQKVKKLGGNLIYQTEVPDNLYQSKNQGETTVKTPNEDTITIVEGDTPRAEDGQSVTEEGQQVSALPFFKQDQFNDVVVQVGGRKLYTCKALLAYNSPVMAKMMCSGTAKSKDLDLPEKELDDVIELLAYIDPRVDYIITEQSAIALLPLAEEYQIDSLKELCEETIINAFRKLKRGKKFGTVPIDITLEYLHIADKYNFTGLKDIVTEEFVNTDDQNAIRILLESTLISDPVKLSVLDKKVDKVHFELDKERRERTAIETKLDDYGHKRFRKPLPE